jgi:large subunit ribosomal protein L5
MAKETKSQVAKKTATEPAAAKAASAKAKPAAAKTAKPAPVKEVEKAIKPVSIKVEKPVKSIPLKVEKAIKPASVKVAKPAAARVVKPVPSAKVPKPVAAKIEKPAATPAKTEKPVVAAQPIEPVASAAARSVAPVAAPTTIKPSAPTAAQATASAPKTPPPRMQTLYRQRVVPEMSKHFKYKNVNQVPRLNKIVINMGLGDVKDNAKSLQLAVEELRMICGQKPVTTKAKKSVANFKVREGMSVGAKVTLRGARMYEFADRFINIALPRVRDFRGVSPKSFDGRGNYALGVKEQLIFPEISYEQIEKVRGFDVCFVTTAKTDEEAKELLKCMGMPFRAN